MVKMKYCQYLGMVSHRAKGREIWDSGVVSNICIWDTFLSFWCIRSFGH